MSEEKDCAKCRWVGEVLEERDGAATVSCGWRDAPQDIPPWAWRASCVVASNMARDCRCFERRDCGGCRHSGVAVNDDMAECFWPSGKPSPLWMKGEWARPVQRSFANRCDCYEEKPK